MPSVIEKLNVTVLKDLNIKVAWCWIHYQEDIVTVNRQMFTISNWQKLNAQKD